MKAIIIFIIILVVVFAIWFFLKPVEQAVSIEDYVTENIYTLSPEKEVLGGKLYVNEIEANGGVGTVYYEDGHIALIADFTYEIDSKGIPTVKTFKVRDQ